MTNNNNNDVRPTHLQVPQQLVCARSATLRTTDSEYSTHQFSRIQHDFESEKVNSKRRDNKSRLLYVIGYIWTSMSVRIGEDRVFH